MRYTSKKYKVLEHIDKSYHYKEDVIKFSEHETFEHFLAKCLLCYELRQTGKHFLTEVIFSNGKRADIVSLEDGEALEVLHSETLEMFKEKLETYPIPAKAFKAKDVIKLNMKL